MNHGGININIDNDKHDTDNNGNNDNDNTLWYDDVHVVDVLIRWACAADSGSGAYAPEMYIILFCVVCLNNGICML